MILSNIFSQFEPISFCFVPITLIGGMMAITWILVISSSHYIESRLSMVSVVIKNVIFNLIGIQDSNKKSWNMWIFSILLYCFSLKILSLIPYTYSHTSHLSFTFSISFTIWVAFELKGYLFDWRAKLSHLVPQGTPIFLIPLMMMIETLSLFIQPLTLGFRLGANLIAGHLLIFLCSCIVWELLSSTYLGIFSFMLIIVLLVLEVAVACMQAVVFIMLLKKYLGSNLK